MALRCNKVEATPECSHHELPFLYLVRLHDSSHLIEWGSLTSGQTVYKPKFILSVIGSSTEKSWTGWWNRSFIELEEKIKTDPEPETKSDKLCCNFGCREIEAKSEATVIHSEPETKSDNLLYKLVYKKLGSRIVKVKGEPTVTLTRKSPDGEQKQDSKSIPLTLQLNYTIADDPSVDTPSPALWQYILFSQTKNTESDDKCIKCAITMNDVEEDSTLNAMKDKDVRVVLLKESYCEKLDETGKSSDWTIHLANGSVSQCGHHFLDWNERDFCEKLLEKIINNFRKEAETETDFMNLVMLRLYLDIKILDYPKDPQTSPASINDWILNNEDLLHRLLKTSLILWRPNFVKYCFNYLKTLEKLDIEIPYNMANKEVNHVVKKMLKNKTKKTGQQDNLIQNVSSEEYRLKKLFIPCLVLKKFDVAKVIWKRFASPICAALSAYTVLKVMSETDTEEQRSTQTAMKYFQKHAVECLKNGYKYNPTFTADLMGIKRPEWKDMTYLSIAYETDCEEFLAMDACHELSDRVWHKGTAHNLQKTQKIYLTPRNIYFIDMASMIFYLFIYGLLLVRYLRYDSFHTLEWLLWSLTFFDLLHVVIEGIQDTSISGLKHVICRIRNILRLYIATTFITGWTLRYLAYSSQEDLMSWARMALGLNYIGFAVSFLQCYYANKNLGPMIVMFKNIGRFLGHFFFLIVIFSVSYGVASQSVYLHGSGYDPLLIFYQSFWTILGQYPLLDEMGFNGAGDNYNCTSSNIAAGEDNCLDTAERYFLAIILGVYAVIINILLLNLLIAKFSAIINLDEKSWRNTWHIQSLELTKTYSRRKVWPPLIVISQPFSFCCPCVCCGDACTPQDPFVVNKSESREFEEYILGDYLAQVERSESELEKNPLSEWLDAETEAEMLMSKVEEYLSISSKTYNERSVSLQVNEEQRKVFPKAKDESPYEKSNNSSFENDENEDTSRLKIFLDEEKTILTQGMEEIHGEFNLLRKQIFTSSRKWEKTSTKISRRVNRLEQELRVAKTSTVELDQAVSRASQQVMELNEKTSRVIRSLSEDKVDGIRITGYHNGKPDNRREYRDSDKPTSVTLSEETILLIANEVLKQMKAIRPARSRLPSADYDPYLKQIYGKPEEDQANQEVASVLLSGRFSEDSPDGKKRTRKKNAYFAVRTRQRYGPLWRCYKVKESNTQVRPKGI